MLLPLINVFHIKEDSDLGVVTLVSYLLSFRGGMGNVADTFSWHSNSNTSRKKAHVGYHRHIVCLRCGLLAGRNICLESGSVRSVRNQLLFRLIFSISSDFFYFVLAYQSFTQVVPARMLIQTNHHFRTTIGASSDTKTGFRPRIECFFSQIFVIYKCIQQVSPKLFFPRLSEFFAPRALLLRLWMLQICHC